MRSLLVLSLAGISLFCAGASAAPARHSSGTEVTTTKKFRTGVDLGLSFPTSSTYGGARAVVGADFYIVHDANIDFGVSYTTGGSRLETGRHYRTDLFGGELNFKIPQSLPNFYVGASAGLASFDAGDALVPGANDLYFGPKLGFFRMITPELSWGLEGKLLFVTGSPLLGLINTLGSFRFHF